MIKCQWHLVAVLLFHFPCSDGDCCKNKRVLEWSGLGNNVEEEYACEVSDVFYLAGNVASFR